jgi:outer membrane receptor protein involved in Fe transport
VNYGYSWFSETIRFADTYVADPDYLADEYKYWSERSVHDIQLRYDLTERFTVYGGINNFTNQEPDIGSGTATAGAGAQLTTQQTPVGARGRFFYLGGRARLGAVSDLWSWR